MWRNSNNMAEIRGTGSERKLITASLYQIVDVRNVTIDEHLTWYICKFLSVLYSNTNSDLTGLPTKLSLKKTPVLQQQYSCLHQYPWGNLRTRVTGPVSWRVPPSTWEFLASAFPGALLSWRLPYPEDLSCTDESDPNHECGTYLIQSIDNAFLFISFMNTFFTE